MGKLGLEFFKFGLYVSIPIVVAGFYFAPEKLDKLVHRHKFVVYPPEDPETVRLLKQAQEEGVRVTMEKERQRQLAAKKQQ